MKPAVVAKIDAARTKHHHALAALPNVIGTAIGYKRRNGIRTRKSSLIVYVREKIPVKALSVDGVIPSAIRFNNKKIATDVFSIGELEYQFGSPPWFCQDRKDNQGTVASLCRVRSSGEPFALTCAHCIEGEDCDPSTPSAINLWDAAQRDYLSIGVSGVYVNTNGYGSVGFSDWGVFSINDMELANRIKKAKPMLMGSTTLSTDVTAVTAHGMVYGSIEHLNAQLSGFVIDLAIYINRGAVFPGDSGVLWRDAMGGAVAIHAIGEHRQEGSSMSYCMFAERISSELASAGMVLLDV